MFDCSQEEMIVIDQQLDPVLAIAHEQIAETQQLALDASRLLSSASDRLDTYRNKGFFKRCWYKLTGKTGAIERANQHDLIEMQKICWRYLNLLQERDLLLAHSCISIRNDLLSLAIREEETRVAVSQMADRIYNRFTSLERRTDQLEVMSQIHTWLLSIKQSDYEERFMPHMRLLKVVKDFYNLKNSGWTWQELQMLQQAVSDVGLPGKQKITLRNFADQLIDEICRTSFDQYQSLIQLMGGDQNDCIPVQFSLENISTPSFIVLNTILRDYTGDLETAEAIKNCLQVPDMEIQLRDLAIELLSCYGLTVELYEGKAGLICPSCRNSKKVIIEEHSQIPYCTHCDIHWNPKDGSILTEVPCGKFVMGDGKDSNCPEHYVYLDSFYIGVYPVTNRQYKRFVDETGHRPPDHADFGIPIWQGNTFPDRNSDHPVVCVNWDDAEAYCRWAGGNLPTEAQWEKAARGPKAFIYAWGNEWNPNLCRNAKNKGSETTCSVYQYREGVSGYGCYHMCGNVSEWCQDWYDDTYYQNSPSKNPSGPGTGSCRVHRGGHFGFSSAERFRSVKRYNACIPEIRSNDRGFRLMISFKDSSASVMPIMLK